MRIKKKEAIRILLLVSGSLMLIYGIFRNEVTYVFNKAVKICLECIGIGQHNTFSVPAHFISKNVDTGISSFSVKSFPAEPAGRKNLSGESEKILRTGPQLLFMPCRIGSLSCRSSAGSLRFFEIHYLFLCDRPSHDVGSPAWSFRMWIPLSLRMVSGTAA